MKRTLAMIALLAIPALGFVSSVPADAQMRGPGPMMEDKDDRPFPGMMGMMMEHMMDRGMMRGGMMGPGAGFHRDKPLSNADITRVIDGRLALAGLSRLKAGTVKDAGEDAAEVEVVTQKGELVAKLKVDRKTGRAAVVD